MMMTVNDLGLRKQYPRENSEEAFAELVHTWKVNETKIPLLSNSSSETVRGYRPSGIAPTAAGGPGRPGTGNLWP